MALILKYLGLWHNWSKRNGFLLDCLIEVIIKCRIYCFSKIILINGTPKQNQGLECFMHASTIKLCAYQGRFCATIDMRHPPHKHIRNILWNQTKFLFTSFLKQASCPMYIIFISHAIFYIGESSAMGKSVTGMNINPVVPQYCIHVDKNVRVKREGKEGTDYF